MKLTRLEIVRALKIDEKREIEIFNKLYSRTSCSDYDRLNHDEQTQFIRRYVCKNMEGFIRYLRILDEYILQKKHNEIKRKIIGLGVGDISNYPELKNFADRLFDYLVPDYDELDKVYEIFNK